MGDEIRDIKIVGSFILYRISHNENFVEGAKLEVRDSIL